MSRPPVDFKKLKEISFEQTIGFLTELKLYKREGVQLRFRCPCGGDNQRGLSVHPDNGFTCFESKKSGTDAVALVAHVRTISQYEAGRLLEEHFFPSRTAPKAHSAPSPAKVEPDGRRGFSPLGYLETSHPVAEMLGLSAATLDALGGGYAPKGTMISRLLIPLRMESGRLVGYLGIATKEEHAPLLLFPDNLEHRCLEDEPRSEQPKEEAAPEPATPSPDALRKLFRVVA